MCENNDHLLAGAWWVTVKSHDLFLCLFQEETEDLRAMAFGGGGGGGKNKSKKNQKKKSNSPEQPAEENKQINGDQFQEWQERDKKVHMTKF